MRTHNSSHRPIASPTPTEDISLRSFITVCCLREDNATEWCGVRERTSGRVSPAGWNVVVGVGLVVFFVAFGVGVGGSGVTGEQAETTAVSETVIPTETATSSDITNRLANASARR